MAIAGATLEHLVENKNSKTLFITHYPVVALSTERKYPGKVSNLHMGFREDIDVLGIRNITFLYKLEDGISSGSYGIECARLAGIPEELLQTASKQAEHMQKIVQTRGQTNRYCAHISVVLLATYYLCNRTRRACEILQGVLSDTDNSGRDKLIDLRSIVHYLNAIQIQ